VCHAYAGAATARNSEAGWNAPCFAGVAATVPWGNPTATESVELRSNCGQPVEKLQGRLFAAEPAFEAISMHEGQC